MIPELFTGQPAWLIILCLALAGAYAIVLYFREKKNEFPVYLKVILGSLRFIAVFLISFMLLSPFLRSITRSREKPLVILALDHSQSMVMNPDSAIYRNELLKNLDDLGSSLDDKAEIRKYLFGEKLVALSKDQGFSGQATFTDRLSDFSGLLSEMANLYDNRNVGAMIIASDGIYNTGSNPLYLAEKLPFPVYTIALGDTNIRRDMIILKVNYNRMVYLNNQFPLEVIVHAHASAGTASRIRIYQDGLQIAEQEVMVDREDFTRSFQFVLQARKSGLNRYLISLDPGEGELSVVNNRKEIFFDVLDARNKVLLLASAPHPDISALRQAIGANQNYEVEESLYKDFKGNLEAYNLVVLHQLPSVDEPAAALLNEMAEKKVPALFILGFKSDLVRFNQAKSGLKIITGKPVLEEAVPALNPNFSAFSISEEAKVLLASLPPLSSPIGEYQVSTAAQVLLFQRIGAVQTSRPLIVFNETLDGRTGVIAGEGIWKWRLYEYAMKNDHQAFDELMNKMVQYLGLKEQKKKFRVYHQTNFMENEPVVFDAELYNDSYELINSPDIGISIQDEAGNQFPFVFNKTAEAYHLNAGAFPPGNYSFVAKTAEESIYPPEPGQFSVTALGLEALNAVADHQLLYQLTIPGQGKMFHPGELDLLAGELLDKEEIKPVTYTHKTYEDLINKWWVVALIVLFLSLEWFLRKRAGSY